MPRAVTDCTLMCHRADFQTGVAPQQISRMFRPMLALQVYQFNVPTFGKGVVFDVDSKIRAEQFKFFASALQSSKLKSYVPLFVKESEVTSQSAR